MKTIDLYSGIGGWRLGLNMAGIDVPYSYEMWKPAIDTYNGNFGTKVESTDIRDLNLGDLPDGIDFIVGSPPCTQFSFSNRGGSGDVNDGLVDIRKMLEIVKFIEPKYWAMENVPRVAKILDIELAKGGRLYDYRKIVNDIYVFNLNDFGLPQRRKRVVAGNYPLKLIQSYSKYFKNNESELIQNATLGNVINALNKKNHRIVDPNYNIKINASDLTDHNPNDYLDKEETRINQSLKEYHPVYNKMSFPDILDKSSRTITATCTRVSRESIIVNGGKDRFRRLSIRERASIQGFPINFKFGGKSYNDRLKMIGNAIPPLFTYFIGKSMLEDHDYAGVLNSLKDCQFKPKKTTFKDVQLETKKNKYPLKRKFRFAIPNLRFGSQVRFELANYTDRDPVQWKVDYYFGPSKNIMTIPLNNKLLNTLQKNIKINKTILNKILDSQQFKVNGNQLQLSWVKGANNVIKPFELLDALGETASNMIQLLKNENLTDIIFDIHKENIVNDYSLGNKYEINSQEICAGFLIGSFYNTINEN